jgi:hypothetical protein
MVTEVPGEEVGDGVLGVPVGAGVEVEVRVAVDLISGVTITACTVNAAAVCTWSGGGSCSIGALQAKMLRMRTAPASFVLRF